MDKNSSIPKRKKRKGRLWGFLFFAIIFFCVGFFTANAVYDTVNVSFLFESKAVKRLKKAEALEMPEEIDKHFIDFHTTARTGTRLSDIKNIVVHYVGNPNTTAQNNRNYFNKPDTTVSSHFVVGLDGEIIQCLPIYERSAASNQRNKDTISIEVCHPDESGKFTSESRRAVVNLCAFLCKEFYLTEDDVIRHYDVTGKECPKYYVKNETEWNDFKKDIGKAIDEIN